MATVYQRECLVDEKIIDEDDDSMFMTFEKGRKYKATENIIQNGVEMCRIFSKYWVWMEAKKFGPLECYVGTDPQNGIQSCYKSH